MQGNNKRPRIEKPDRKESTYSLDTFLPRRDLPKFSPEEDYLRSWYTFSPCPSMRREGDNYVFSIYEY